MDTQPAPCDAARSGGAEIPEAPRQHGLWQRRENTSPCCRRQVWWI